MHNKDQFYLDIAKTIKQYGCHIMAMAAYGKLGSRTGTPQFAYTIGLSETSLGAEIIALGLPPHFAASIFNDILYRLRNGETIELDAKDMRWAMGKDGKPLPTMFKACHPELVAEYGVQAFQYYKRDDIKFIQMVIPDARGIFPGEQGYDRAYMDSRQKLLCDVPTSGLGYEAG